MRDFNKNIMLFTIERYAFVRTLHITKRLFRTSLNNRNINQPEEFASNCDEQLSTLRQHDRKVLKISLLGNPNAGKSTLVNQLVNRTICSASAKVHTTLHKAEAVFTEGGTQLVFLDTPGIVTDTEMRKYKLQESFKKDPEQSYSIADVVGIVQDASNLHTRTMFHKCIVQLLKDVPRENIILLLILNKVDKVKNKVILLELINVLMKVEGMPKFNDVFMTSALTGDGINDLKTYLLDLAKPGEWLYDKETFTDQLSETIIVQTVRAKCMDVLIQNCPYIIKVKLQHYDVGADGTIVALIDINCPNQRLVKYLLKGKAWKIKTIAQSAEEELRHAFRCHVKISLTVQYKDEK